MTFNDIFKSSFLENITEFSAVDTLIAMAAALIIGMFIFVVYKKTFNSDVFHGFCHDTCGDDDGDYTGHPGGNLKRCFVTWYGGSAFHCSFSCGN